MAIAGVAALTSSACTGSSKPGGGSTSGTLVNGKTFTWAIATDPGSLDPLMTVLSATRGVDRFLYASLVNLTSDGSPVPSLAEKWSATTTDATFTLRPGITCSDGSPVTATDVAANINFVGDPKNKSPLAGIQVMPATKATADDATRTVTVKSGAPDAFLLRNVGTLAIACGKGLTERGRLAKGQDGAGMFTMTEVVPNDHYTLTRRKDFTWGPGNWNANQKGLPDKVVVKVIQNETTATNLLLSGQLNAAAILGPDQQRITAQHVFHSDLLAPLGVFFYNQAPAARRRARQYPHEFSGGMRQRAMIGMGLMGDPRLVIADEPTTALDVTVQRQVLRLLARVRADTQAAIMLISHDITIVSQTCDRILVMYAGRIVEDLPTADPHTAPRHPYTRALLAAVPDLDTDRHAPLAVIPGRPPEPDQVPSGCAFAPRCPLADDRCRSEDPALERIGPAHRVACWHPVGAETATGAAVSSPTEEGAGR